MNISLILAAVAFLATVLLVAQCAGAITAHRLNDTGISPCYSVDGEDDVCLPHVYIVGMPKAGTSALWYKLRDHHQVHLTRKHKEDCPRSIMLKHATASSGDSTDPKRPTVGFELPDVFDWARASNFNVEDARKGGVLLSSCLLLSSSSTNSGESYFELLRQELGYTNPRVVLIIRDWPEWLWSVYNFFCAEHFGDVDCPSNRWRNSTLHHRSPQHFHDFVTGHPEWFLHEVFRVVDGVRRAVDDGNWLVISQHDLLRDPAAVMSRVEEFAGLEPGRYQPGVLQAVVNTRDAPGAERRSEAGGHIEDMMPQTLEILQDRWGEDCNWVRREAKVCLPSCCSGGGSNNGGGSDSNSSGGGDSSSDAGSEVDGGQ